MKEIKDYFFKLCGVFKRPFNSKFSNGFALVPMQIKSIHPVFFSHCIHLQKVTSNPLFAKRFHAINRLPSLFINCQYIAEVESFLTLAKNREDSKFFKSYDQIVEHVENEINTNRLLKIVYESESSYHMHKRWHSDKINSIATYINQVPRRIYDRVFEKKKELNVIITATRPTIKGLFMLDQIIKEVNRYTENVNFTCICEDFNFSNSYTNLRVIKSKKMNFKDRDNVFLKMDLMLNLSLGDTLGSFLDSIEYSIPMISFIGQHGDTYIKDNETGFLIDNPVYYYTSGLGEIYHNRNQFEKYILELHEKNYFKDSISKIISLILKLDSNRDIFYCMREDLRENSLNNFPVNNWLNEWKVLYKSL